VVLEIIRVFFQAMLNFCMIMLVCVTAGLTALHVAAQLGHKETVDMLLSAGASVNAVDGKTNDNLHEGHANHPFPSRL